MIRLIPLLLLTAFLSGCVHLDEYIQINRNGSAKIVISYSMPLSGLPLLKDSEAVLSELNNKKMKSDLPRIFEEDALRKHFRKYKGVDIISLRVTRDTERITTYFNLFVDDFREVLREGMLPYMTLEKAGDDYVFSGRYPFNLSKMKENKSLKKVLAEMKVNFKVKTPSKITKTNATSKLANLAEWKYSGKNPITKSDGRFIVQFEGKSLTFLDKKDKSEKK